MKRALSLVFVPAVLLAAGLASRSALLTGQSTTGAKSVDWVAYTADIRGSKYSPLDQVNAGNFNKLEVAWRFKTDNIGNRPEYKLEGTPLEVGGVVYATAGSRRDVMALDAKTGQVVWSVKNGDPKKGETMTNAPMVVKDKVIVGISGGEFGVQGRVPAYELKDGKKVWSAYSVGPDSEILFDAKTTSQVLPVEEAASQQ